MVSMSATWTTIIMFQGDTRNEMKNTCVLFFYHKESPLNISPLFLEAEQICSWDFFFLNDRKHSLCESN